MKHDVALSLLGVMAQGGVRFGTNLLIGRLGGPSALGLTSSAVAIAQLASLCGPTTAGAAASKFVARADGQGDAAEALGVAKHVTRITIATAIVAGLAAALLWHGDAQSLWWQRAVVFTLVLGYSGYALARGVQFGAGRIRRSTVWDLSTATLAVAGVAFVMLANLHPLIALVPVASSLLLYTLSGWFRGPGRSLTQEAVREIRTFVLLGVVGTASSAGLLQGSILVARSVGGLTGAGEYASAMALATPASLIGSSVSLALFPSMSVAYGRGDTQALLRMTDSAFRTLTSFVPLAFIPLVVCAPSIQVLVWGDAFAREPMVLPVLLLACMANVLGVTANNFLTSRGGRGMRASTIIGLVGASTGVLYWVLNAQSAGIVDVAVGYLLAATVIWLLPIALVSRTAGFRWSRRTLEVVVVSGITLGAAAATSWRGPLAQVAAAVVLCGLWALTVRPSLSGSSREPLPG